MVLALLLLGLWFLTSNDREQGPLDGWSARIKNDIPGQWVGETSPSQVIFTPQGEYQIINFQGQTVLGDYTITSDDLVEVPLRFRNYSGTWYFEPIEGGALRLEVEELDYYETFHRTH